MKKSIGLGMLVVCLALLSACGGGRSAGSGRGPVVVSIATLTPAPDVPLPTRLLTDTPPPPTPFPTAGTPLQAVTIEGSVVLITPTLPPSKTPTATQTQSPTPTLTRTPTPVPTLLPTVALPGGVLVPVPVQSGGAATNCAIQWFFQNPVPASCPVAPVLNTNGALVYFERGFMVWVEKHDAIYVFYNDTTLPRWQVFSDDYVPGSPEVDPSLDAAAPPLTWQPRRGFGLLWRNQPAVRDRIGWAVVAGETAYALAVQAASDSTIFISMPNGGVVSLFPGGGAWQLN